MKTSSAKAKGRKLQQTVRDAILATFPDLEPDDVRSCPMGSGGEDVQLSPAAQRVFPYSVECKRRAAIALVYDALGQAQAYTPEAGQNDRTPIAVVQADRKRPLVVMDLDDFLAAISSTRSY